MFEKCTLASHKFTRQITEEVNNADPDLLNSRKFTLESVKLQGAGKGSVSHILGLRPHVLVFWTPTLNGGPIQPREVNDYLAFHRVFQQT